MFLYLGDGKYKRKSDIIGIFDMDSATVCVTSRQFLSKREKAGAVESDGDLPKSFLLCEKREKGIYYGSGKIRKRAQGEKKYSVFLSKLSSSVLFARTAGVREGFEDEET